MNVLTIINLTVNLNIINLCPNFHPCLQVLYFFIIFHISDVMVLKDLISHASEQTNNRQFSGTFKNRLRVFTYGTNNFVKMKMVSH